MRLDIFIYAIMFLMNFQKGKPQIALQISTFRP